MTDFKKVFIDTAPIIYDLQNSELYYENMKAFWKKYFIGNIEKLWFSNMVNNGIMIDCIKLFLLSINRKELVMWARI